VVAINRAVAVAEHRGPEVALAALDAVDHDAVAAYQPFHATRADLLARAGRTHEALAAYDRAIELTPNPAEHRFLTRQREVLAAG
jgi:RNA polymerase sigma-70 factor (ECF subfamily)